MILIKEHKQLNSANMGNVSRETFSSVVVHFKTKKDGYKMTIYEYVKFHSGLVQSDAIHRLCDKIKTYMNKKGIEKISPELIIKVKRMTESEVYG